jgi:hypothetical protein
VPAPVVVAVAVVEGGGADGAALGDDDHGVTVTAMVVMTAGRSEPFPP